MLLFVFLIDGLLWNMNFGHA